MPYHATRFFLRLMFCLYIVSVNINAAAQTTSTWQAPGVASWNDPANWIAGVPDQAGDHAIFGPGFPAGDTTVLVADLATNLGTFTYNNPNTLSLFAPTMTFDGNGGAALIDIQNGNLIFETGSFVLNTELDLSVATGASATVGIGFTTAASLTGPGGLNVLGGGEVVLNGANTYAGATHIQNGTLRVLKNSSLGLGTGTDADGTFIHTGGKLDIASDSITLPNEKITLDGGTLTGGAWKLNGPVQLNDGLITGNGWTLNGPLTTSGGILSSSGWKIEGPVTLDGELSSRGTGRIDGDMTGVGGLHVGLVSTVQLSGNNSYLGQTNVVGTLTAASDTALGAGAGTDADGTVVHAGGKLIIGTGRQIINEKITLSGGRLEGTFFAVDGPVASDGGIIGATAWQLNGDIELIGGLTLNGGVSGSINGVIHGPGGVRIVGGTTSFAQTNTYGGQTIIDGGELTIADFSALGSANGLPADATVINPSGVLRVTGVSTPPSNELIILNGGKLLGGGVIDTPIDVQAHSVLYAGTYCQPFTGTHNLLIGNGDVVLKADSPQFQGTFIVDLQPGETNPVRLIAGVPDLTIQRVDMIQGWLIGDSTTISDNFFWEAGVVTGSIINTGLLTLQDDLTNNDQLFLDGELTNAGRMMLRPDTTLKSRGYPYPNNGSIMNQLTGQIYLQDGSWIRDLPITNHGQIIADAPDAKATIGRIDNHGTVWSRQGESLIGPGNHTGSFMIDDGATMVIGSNSSTLSTFAQGSVISGAGDVQIDGDTDFAGTINTTGRVILVGYDMNYLPGAIFGTDVASWEIHGRHHYFNTGTPITFASPVVSAAGFYGTDTLIFEDSLTLGDSDFYEPLKVYLNGNTTIMNANSAGAYPSIYQAEFFNSGHFYINAQIHIGDGAVLHNLPSGHLELDHTGTSNFAEPMRLDNQGLVTTSGYSNFYADIENRGTFRIKDSGFRMGRYRGLDGSRLELVDGASVELSGGDELFDGSTLTGTGEVVISVGNGEDPVTVRAGAVFHPTSIRFYSHSGHLLIEEGADVQFSKLTMPTGGTFELYSDIHLNEGFSIESSRIQGSAMITLTDTSYFYRASLQGINIVNEGHANWFDRVNLENGTVWENRPGSLVESNLHLIIHGTGTEHIENAGIFHFRDQGYSVRLITDFYNTGTLMIEGNVSLEQSDIIQTDGVIRLMAGTHLTSITTNGLILDGGRFEGSGIFGAPVYNNAATVAPGNSRGTLTIDGDYTQLLNAVMQIELGGTSLGAYDRLIVTGLFNAGGTFELLLLDGFMPSPGDVFDVLDFNALVAGSAFDQLLLPELGAGRSWDTSELLTTGAVRVIPEPAGLFVVSFGCLLYRRRHAGR